MQCNHKCNSLFTSFPSHLSFHFQKHAFRSLLRVFYALRTVHVKAVTSHQHAPHYGYNAVVGECGAGCHLLRTNRHSLPKNRSKMWGKLKYCGSILPCNFLQTKGEMCTKFGSDRFRNVDLYKFHTNKQTNIHLYI
jgi:hypothetical protein